MYCLIKAELYKLVHDKSFFILSALSVMLGSFLMLDQGQLKGYDSVSAALYNAPILMLLTCVFGTLYLGKDFADHTLYHMISAGHSRNHVFFSKAIVFIVGSNVILLLQPILCIAYNTGIHGWGGHSFGSDFGRVTALFLTTAILNAAMCGISLLTAFICRDIGRTLSIPALVYFLNIFLLNGPNAQAIARFIPLGQLRLLLEDSSSAGAALLVGIIFLMCFCLAAVRIFNQSELY
ncbi:ABC transporter permease [Paenibacillus sp. FSL K6-1096]|uniref:ABC transporter permease n=1 Tax=Paenibacillus sp. FSL K6-1096 TaxID=2921460 RepID=UPI0030EDBF07